MIINLDEFDEILNDILLMVSKSDDLLYTTFDTSHPHTFLDHSINVGILAAYFGKHLNLNNSELYELTLAALLHDIGLTKLPKGLIHKKENLTEKEREIFQKHPYYGEKILSSAISTTLERISVITTTVFQEHEREGGIGYPNKLKGEQIHIYAKIIGLADIFEVTTHSRKNRQSTLIYESIKKIIDLSENHFSNKIKKALVKQFSLFPKGTIVKLNSGEIGKVESINPVHPMRPLISILYSNRNSKLLKPEKRHLKDTPFLYIENVIDEEDLTL
jgi:HD-GYP domain-containing protein (c-di-GMP phosphodiesterase class II)